MSRASESRPRYGVLCAGAVSKSIIGRLPAKAREIGPVAGASYRVASRVANTLRAGYPVRSANALNVVPVVLFHSPPDQAGLLLSLLDAAAIDWARKSLIVCDCRVDRSFTARFCAKGASVAIACEFGIPGLIVIEGTARAFAAARKIARDLRLRVIEINKSAADTFDASVTLATAAFTPLLDSAAALLRDSGVRDVEAPRLAAALFEQTSRAYAHSGKQSWEWYIKKPAIERIEAQLAGCGPETGPLLRELLLYGLDVFGKHPEIAAALRKKATSE